MSKCETSLLAPEQVEEFLKQNPDFFYNKEDLLADIRVPHRHGQAISLVEKQLEILRERNTELRHRLGDLIDNARSNDRLFTHTRKLVLALLDCKNIAQAVDVIDTSFNNDFGVEKTQIILFDSNTISRARNDPIDRAQQHIGKYLKARQTVGGGLAANEMDYLFGTDAKDIGSAAIAILAYGDIYGVIAIGNENPSYYQSGMGTMFLGYIAEVFSRVLRNLL